MICLTLITGAIYLKRHLLAKDDLKTELLTLIKQTFQAKGWQLHHWVILNNHYHLFVSFPRSALMVIHKSI